MSRATISPEQQIQRINHLKARLKGFADQPAEFLVTRPNPDAWHVMEVMEHMIIAQDAYKDKIEDALSALLDAKDPLDMVKSRAIPSFLIKRFPPKEGRIRFKMKTFGKFKPNRDQTWSVVQRNQVIQDLDDRFEQLKGWVLAYRNKAVGAIRFNSAIGASVRFNVAEACEFVLCHAERHFQQIENNLVIVQELSKAG